jgi:NADPH:quinone reductase-like Zn-dependent oxidoreductase
MDEEPRHRSSRSKGWSLQSTVLALFVVTLLLAAFTVWTGLHTNTGANFTGSEVLIDLTAVGTFLSGLAAALVFTTDYWRRSRDRAREERQEDGEADEAKTVNQTHITININRKVKSGEVDLIADLVRSVNGKKAVEPANDVLAIEQSPAQSATTETSESHES